VFSKKIKFISPLKTFIPDPKPASVFIPKEYKEMSAYLSNSKKNPSVKKCIPFLDAYTTGYIIPFPIDYEFRPADINPHDGKEEISEFAVNETIPLNLMPYFEISHHNSAQVAPELKNTHRTIDIAFKISNPWIIKTPPGYSCIFTSPLNHNSPFEPIDAVVDTDNYDQPIKFPFYWTGDISKSFILKKGSPMIMVIPFKRESWQMEVVYQDVKKWDNSNERLKFFSKMTDNYKNKSWVKKSFK